MSAMENILIYKKPVEKEVVSEEYNISINVFLSGKEYNLIE